MNRTLLSITALLLALAAVASAQVSGDIVPNPNAVQLRNVWQVTGRPLKADNVGNYANALGDITGDSVDDFAVSVPAERGTWKVFAGRSPAPDTTAFWSIDSAISPMIVGDFLGDGTKFLGVVKFRWEKINGSSRLYRIPWFFRVDSLRVGGSPSFIVDPSRMTPSVQMFFSDMSASDLDGDGDDELMFALEGARRGDDDATTNPEIWIYRGGPRFHVDTPTVIISEPQGVEQGSLDVHAVNLDADGRLDLIIGGRYAAGDFLSFFRSDPNSPDSWAERPPDRTLQILPDGTIGVNLHPNLMDLDGDGIVDIAGRVNAGTSPGIYLFLSSSGKDMITRPYTLDDADIVFHTTKGVRKTVGYLTDSLRRYASLPLGGSLGGSPTLFILSSGPNGPNASYDAYYTSAENIFGRITGPIGDVTGDGWLDMITGDEGWGAFVDQGIAVVLAGGPYIPTDDPSVDVEDVPVAGRAAGLFLWPNPVADRLNIAWRGDLRRMPARFEVHDITGNQVACGEVDPSLGAALWNASQAPAGTYLLSAFDADGDLIASSTFIKR